ncbi:MAG: response regulator [bacterium]|nr:response regulator [bacterium]
MKSDKKVLMIESDAFFAQIYAQKMKDRGFCVEIVSSGDAGIRKACSDTPSCIVLDLLLPVKDGFQVLDELKGEAETKGIPVFILTDLSEPEDIDRCMKAGACGFAIKAHTTPEHVISQLIGILGGE